ncbi:helix-turn-helix transcriptional regulator [Mycobacterium sp. B14F4]|uniref:helix-turn-helix transcriptional regulator n=1 Tax=Mycobacterium sp. B14F4 TaxID=3153565 RepID=UPI00325F5F36
MGAGQRKKWSENAPPWFKRAIEFVDTYAHTQITLADIATVAHVTPRALQLAFREQLETTPIGYLLGVRLQRAHLELTAAHPSTSTVREIARRWGFRHSGRFARQYRKRYGVYPEDTLKGVYRTAG